MTVSTADVAQYIPPVRIWGPQDGLPTERATRVTPDRVQRKMGPTLLGLLLGRRARGKVRENSQTTVEKEKQRPLARCAVGWTLL